MENNLSINELKTLISYLHTLYSSYETANNIAQFTQRWGKMLLRLQTQNYRFIASSYGTEDQLFQKTFTFSDVELTMSFDIKIASSLCERHIPVTNIPLELFELQSHRSQNSCFIYHPIDGNVNQTINQPIIIADIPVITNVLGYVIDGNHRVSQLKVMCKNSIQAYILNEKITFICLQSLLHKAIYLYLRDIADITFGKMTDSKLFLRIGFLEDYCKKKLV